MFEDREKSKKTILRFFHMGYLYDPARTEKTILQMPWRSKDFCVSSHLPPTLLRVFGRAWQVRTLGATC